MRVIDADRLQKQFDEKSTNPNYRVNMHNIKSIISNAPTVEVIPKSEYKTDLKIILNRLKVRMKDRDEDNGGEPLNAVDRGYHLAYEHLCEEIDNLLKENKDEAKRLSNRFRSI